jgi:hypothetical protein
VLSGELLGFRFFLRARLINVSKILGFQTQRQLYPRLQEMRHMFSTHPSRAAIGKMEQNLKISQFLCEHLNTYRGLNFESNSSKLRIEASFGP